MGRRRGLTAEDIATLSGVSRTTVFAVVKGKPGVSPRTRERVWEAIREHGYANGLVQKSLLSEVSKTVGVVVGSINNPFYTEVVSGIHNVLRAEGFQRMLYHGTEDRPEEGIEAFGAQKTYDLRGYIVSAGEVEQYQDHLRWLQRMRRPLVTIMEAPGLPTHTVRFDNRKANRDATNYLIEKGHRKIAFLTGPVRSATSKERTIGLMESRVEHEIPFQDNMIVRGGDTPADGYHAALKVLTNESYRPKALICCNDMVAIGCYRAAYELELRIPDDISIVGFDGIEMGEVMGPPLTTLSVFPREIGRMSAELLLQIIHGEAGRSEQPIEKVVEHRLMERNSVRDLNVGAPNHSHL